MKPTAASFIREQYETIPIASRRSYTKEMVQLLKLLSISRGTDRFNGIGKMLFSRIKRYQYGVNLPPMLPKIIDEPEQNYMDRIYREGGYSCLTMSFSNGGSGEG